MQFRLRAPDDTVLPADDGGDDDLYFQVNYDVNLKSNWQTFSFTWDKGDFSDADFARFAQLYTNTASLQPQFQVSGAASDFGNDADNVVVIDNLRFVRLVEGMPPLSIQANGSNVVVSWNAPATGQVKLQSAPSPLGPFSDVAGATSPYTAPSNTASSQFFRTVWVP
jgi:hypothetical protein